MVKQLYRVGILTLSIVFLGGCVSSMTGGTLVGGAAGGLLGHQLYKKHKNRDIAVGVGTLAGALAGGAVGKGLDDLNRLR